MPNVNVTYAEMQAAARQLQAGGADVEGDLTRLKQLVDSLVTDGAIRRNVSRQGSAFFSKKKKKKNCLVEKQ